MPHELLLSDFDFELPAELVAQRPLPERTDSRLLRLDSTGLADLQFRDLPSLLAPGDVLVLNDTRVMKARLLGNKPSGGRIEALVERLLDRRRVLALVRTSHTPKAGQRIDFQVAQAEVIGRHGDLFELTFDADVQDVLERAGKVPLPPYIEHDADGQDEARYQTVYARHPGAVAAPTAGLHLSEALLAQLRGRGVEAVTLTLHVGAGTFQPVRCERIADHVMHAERFEVPPATARAVNAARLAGRRVVAVGTTALRALESAARDGQVLATEAETRLFIRPGYRFQVVDRLVTNFHLPRSTLLMLVSAFAGMEPVRAAYRHAVAQRYRFFSYGDAMLADLADDSSA
jgi:S-adenosylmethionine:tRNA ribosyltransferase-isomerase